MKKYLYKYSNVLSTFALVFVTYSANRNCSFWFHQDELPKNIGKYRKF